MNKTVTALLGVIAVCLLIGLGIVGYEINASRKWQRYIRTEAEIRAKYERDGWRHSESEMEQMVREEIRNLELEGNPYSLFR